MVAIDVAPNAATARQRRVAANPRSLLRSTSYENKTAGEPSTLRRNSIGAWIVLTVLSLLLVATGVVAYLGWSIGDANVPTSGYIAMGFGVMFSLLVGIGLMTLLFYSSRKGYDEPAVLIEESRVDHDDRLDVGQQREYVTRLGDTVPDLRSCPPRSSG
ncbi:hypothetical protein ACE10Z_05235 [Bradyrhizobium sp. Pha-3]|uniref:hypothetical protein n=1 Tax=Bradyrhizobium sp. Pha-3 TaxID=208375 RepID=UPI0035D5247F